MKNNYLKTLPLILSFPFLMANAPAPGVYSDGYKDFTFTYANKKETIDENNFAYTFNLNNKGQGYIDYISVDNGKCSSSDTCFAGSAYPMYTSGGLFHDEVFEPGYNGEIILLSRKDTDNLDKLNIKASAYSNLAESNVTVSEPSEVKITLRSQSNYDEACYYDVDLSIENGNTERYYYSAILKLSYEGKEYYVKLDGNKKYQMQTTNLLDLEQLTVNEVIAIRDEHYGYNEAKVFSIIVIVFIVGFFLLISMGIFSAIFFPAMRRRRRARRLAQQNNSNK